MTYHADRSEVAENDKYAAPLPTIGFRMDGIGLEKLTATAPVSITVLSVTPLRAGKLFALASVELEIDGVSFEIHGIRATHVPPAAY